ncbi:MAG: carbamoyl-phosphate synthase small subunit [Candidatus Hydrogenedentota bacterium]|nr:MAG: carbamoyl-phosphate synthase small subunit [Candidatus Hydrogenedentota bacterium]
MVPAKSAKEPAVLALEDGSRFFGCALGKRGVTEGEVVFNTSFTGYEEILTDPSYARQIICMAFPAIGNYGFSKRFCESRTVRAAGFVLCDAARGGVEGRNIDEYLKEAGIVGIEGIDTRAVVRRVRSAGAMRGVILSGAEFTENTDRIAARIASVPPMKGANLVSEWEGMAERVWNPDGKMRIGVLDCGAKEGIVRSLMERDCRVEVLSWTLSAQDILGKNLDGVLLSNGPGDPEPLAEIIEVVRGLLGNLPLMGICLGHQILSLAAGARTYKLPFGHRGGNHPVLHLDTKVVSITSQNHGFAVAGDSLPEGVRETERNLYDGTNEGVEIVGKRAFSVQYHPEARPGPHDAAVCFDRFLAMIRGEDA